MVSWYFSTSSFVVIFKEYEENIKKHKDENKKCVVDLCKRNLDNTAFFVLSFLSLFIMFVMSLLHLCLHRCLFLYRVYV